MRSVQELFNLIIDKGYYGEERAVKTSEGTPASELMCHAISYASTDKIISLGEKQRLTKAVQSYIRPFFEVTLKHHLETLGRPSTLEDRIKIYRDWENRPTTKLTDVQDTVSNTINKEPK